MGMRNRLSHLAEAGAILPTHVKMECAISSWITWSTYLDVVRGYCSVMEAMLKIHVVLHHG